MTSISEHDAPEQQGPGHGAAGQEPTPPESSMLTQVLGQLAAWLTVVIAMVYISGTLTLSLNLWYRIDPWMPVLGQLPQNLILLGAFGHVIFPAIVVGVVCSLLFKGKLKFGKQSHSLVAWVVTSGLLASLPVLTLLSTASSFKKNALRPGWQIFLLCFALNLVWLGVVYVISVEHLPKVRPSLHRIARIAIFTIAAIPCVASISAVFHLPTVYICTPSITYDNGSKHYLAGNLIGTSGQWAYLTEFRTGENEDVVVGRYIAVVPLSAIKFEEIGNDASCASIHTK
jgi:hypothetical protein